MQYKNGVKNYQADALSQLQTNAEAGKSTARLNTLTFETFNVGSCNILHPKCDANKNLLVTHTATSKKPVYATDERVRLVGEQLSAFFEGKLVKI